MPAKLGRNSLLAIWFTLLQLNSILMAAEKPELSLLYPAGGQVATSVDVVASGKFPAWPVRIWCDCEGIQWKCHADAGKLQATIASTVQPGLYWVRMFDAAGASDVRPFLVGTAPEQIEVEPNDQIDQAHAVDSLPTTLFGVLNKNADIDLISVTLDANQWLVATVDSSKWLNSPADASLQFLDSRGFVLAENLDHVGLDPYLQFQVAEAGQYFVRIFGFPATPDSTIAFSGGSDWVYRLRLGDQPLPLDSALDFANQAQLAHEHIEVASGQHTAIDHAFELPELAFVSGVVVHPHESNYLRFSAKAGTTYQIRLLARQFGSPLDATLAILDASGKELVRLDDVGQDRDPMLSWKAPADGNYFIAISDFHHQGGEGYRYLLRLEAQSPDFAANVETDMIVAKLGQESEVIVNVPRDLGYSATIGVSIEGLPSSLSCPKVESQHGTETEKKVTLKLTASEPYQGPISIVAQSVEEPPRSRTADTPSHKPLWLSVAGE